MVLPIRMNVSPPEDPASPAALPEAGWPTFIRFAAYVSVGRPPVWQLLAAAPSSPLAAGAPPPAGEPAAGTAAGPSTSVDPSTVTATAASLAATEASVPPGDEFAPEPEEHPAVPRHMPAAASPAANQPAMVRSNMARLPSFNAWPRASFITSRRVDGYRRASITEHPTEQSRGTPRVRAANRRRCR